MTTAKRATSLSALSASNALSLSTPSATAISALSAPAKEEGEIGEDIRRASLEDILAMAARGDLRFDPDAPEGPDLPDSFWENAVVVEPPKTRSVHLKLDPDVFRHFLQETGGKGHITRMQNVLKSYVLAQQRKAAKKAP